MSGFDESEMRELMEFLGSKRGGKHLPSKFIGAFYGFLEAVDVGYSVKELMSWDSATLIVVLEDFASNADGPVPRAWKNDAIRWFDDAQKSFLPGARERKGTASVVGGAEDDSDFDDSASVFAPGAEGQRAYTTQLRSDMNAIQTTDPMIVVMLSGAIISGAVPSREIAEIVGYQGDFRPGDYMKGLRKAGIATLLTMAKSNKLVEIQGFFQSLVSSLSSAGMMVQAMLVNDAHTQVSISLSNDPVAIGAYWLEYATKRYKGRGLPVLVDSSLIVRFAGSAPAAAAAERMLETVTALERTVKELSLRLERQEKKPPGGGGGGGASKNTCYFCGEVGHNASHCPAKLEAKKKKDATASRKAAAEAAEADAEDDN